MAKRIEATKYIKRDDLLAYPLRRATCDKGKANTRFVDGVEAAMEYAESLPAVRVKRNNEIEDVRPLYARIKALDSLVYCKDCEYSYEDIAGLMRCYKGNADRIVRKDFFCADGVKREVADD